MNYPGTDLKFKVTAAVTGFSLQTDPFVIIIKDSASRVIKRITNNDCFFDTDHNCYLPFEHPQQGVFFALFKASVPDDDYAKQTATETDFQYLTTVGSQVVPQQPLEPHKVSYEQVYVISVDNADYLADRNGNYILTSDGKRIQFNVTNPTGNMSKTQLNMTGAEFQRLIEGRSQDGSVNTVPEVFDTMAGIPDTETVKDKIDEATEPKMDGVTQAQFDAIFNPNRNQNNN